MSLPVTSAQIARDVSSLGVRRGEVLLAHTSLSAVSDALVVGGAVAVIEALFEAIGEEGTLVMPAFSADYSDPATWSNPPVPEPWWPVVRAAMPAWQADRARTFGIGVVAETFRAMRGVRRSEHPQSSFCAWGRQRDAIVAAHPLDDPLGPAGPLGRLRALEAKVVLIGCGFGSCTAFHLGEHETERAARRVSSAAPVLRDGARVWVRWSEPAYDASRFTALGADFVRTEPCTTGRVGMAASHAFALSDAARFAARWLDARAG